MATRIRIKMNSAGARDLLKSRAVGNDLLGRGHRAASAARSNGAGKYLVTIQYGKNRARVSVITVDDAARRSEAEGRALTRALDAARG